LLSQLKDRKPPKALGLDLAEEVFFEALILTDDFLMALAFVAMIGFNL
jgi:hypothetical protein